ncbi:hypothetical protein J437_LFUL010295 [Ladona fulva]|uniref:Peptidase S1 domain-containing protein n=1 Tax=Ladona fulva TaxID=123851 RepID=A0A8K0KAW7_LADFU|nr:hypothetical protein J437_LFUL010295 [Ladona fulva]
MLNCSKNGEQMMCVPLEQCPDSRYNPRRQFCSWTPGNADSIPFRGPGVCCLNTRSHPQNKPPRAATSTSIPQMKGNNGFESLHPKPTSQVLSSKAFELGTRSGIESNGECGILEKDGKVGTRIIGGSGRQQILGAAIGGISLPSASESPWTAVIGEFSKDGSVDWFCGGSLLNQFTVLTAAHCARRRKPDIVRVGEVDLRRNTKLGEGKGEEMRVKQVLMHPDYHPPSFYNDIAILTLERAIMLNRPGGARTICLPPKSEATTAYNGKEAILTGWGHLSFGGDRSPILQEVRVTVFSNEDCSRSYASPAAATVTKRSYPSGIIDSQLCAGDRQGKKDACQGDSGGPLVVKGKDGRYSLIGVISSGIGCGSKQYPGVYVRVSSYIDWILSNMKS